MKTIAIRSTPEEAHLVRGRLESAGIPAFVRDEFTIQTIWIYSNAIGGVRVEVNDEDEAAAGALLNAPSPAPEEPSEEVSCPACGSTKTARHDLSRRWALFVVCLFKLPLPFSRHSWKCGKCGQIFKVPPSAARRQIP